MKRINNYHSLFVLFLFTANAFYSINSSAQARLFVAEGGSQGETGSLTAPFSKINDAVAKALPGDTIFLRGGIYRETIDLNVSGKAEAPICIKAYQNEKVILDGTESLKAEWTPFRDGIYVTHCEEPVEQLFDEAEMLNEARWPNAGFNQRWDRSAWASSSIGSFKDLMVSEALKGSPVDWTGAVAVLNVGHQYKTWVREVTEFNPAEGSFTYELNERLGDGSDSGRTWQDDYFYLFGKLEMLDAPGEWYYDIGGKKLYFLPIKETPEEHRLYVKKRDYGVIARNAEHVLVQDLHFFACNFRGEDCSNLTIENCHFRFPLYSRLANKRNNAFTSLSGNSNTLRYCSLAFSQLGGFYLSGNQNILFNCIVKDVNWWGDISYAGVRIQSDTIGCQVRNLTIGDVGNIGLGYRGVGNEILGNHVFSTGLMCRDIAAVHTGSPSAYGSVCAYNWVHHSSGKGIRGDDQTRGLTVHHNVVWNTGEWSIIVKGDFNQVYNNTIFDLEDAGNLHMPVRQEPKKWWTRHEILDQQNKNSDFYNNIADILVWRIEKNLPTNFSNNLFYVETPEGKFRDVKSPRFVHDLLEDPENWNFIPKSGTELIDKGLMVPGLAMEKAGPFPDLGAYERGGENWIPGATWKASDLNDNAPTGNQTDWEIGILPSR